MALGWPGAPVTVSVRAPPVPHELVADTEIVQVVKLAGQFTVTPLRLVGPTNVPQLLVQL